MKLTGQGYFTMLNTVERLRREGNLNERIPRSRWSMSVLGSEW